MDDTSPHERWTPRTTPADVADGGKQGRAGRILATASSATTRVREQAVKAAVAARPHVVPIVTVVAMSAFASLLSSAREDGRPTGRAMLPSSSCQPTGGARLRRAGVRTHPHQRAVPPGRVRAELRPLPAYLSAL